MQPSAEEFLGKPSAEDFLDSGQPNISLSKGANLEFSAPEIIPEDYVEGFTSKLGSELSSARHQILHSFDVKNSPTSALGGIIQGIGSITTATGRPVGMATQDFVNKFFDLITSATPAPFGVKGESVRQAGRETGAILGSTTDAATQLLSPQILGKGTEIIKMLSGGIKSLIPSITAKAAKLTELYAAIDRATEAARAAREVAMGPVSSAKLMQGDLPKAKQAIKNAKDLLDRTVREAGMKSEGEIALIEDQIKVLEKQFAENNEIIIAKIQKSQGKLTAAKAAEKSTPLAATEPLPGATELKTAAESMGPELGKLEETGQFFKESFKEASQIAYAPLKKGYEDILTKAGDTQHDISPITAAKDALLEQAGFTRKALPTKTETVAGKLPGTATGPTEVPDLKMQGDEVYRRTSAYLQSHAAEFGPGTGTSATIPVEIYKDLGLPAIGTGATVGQIQAGRSEVRAAQRALEDNGHWKAARQMDKLEQAYTASLKNALPPEEFTKLGRIDAEYAKFIEIYGFGSPASKIGELPSENMIAKIFPEGKPTGYLSTPNMVLKALPNQAIRDRLAGTFLRQNIMAEAIDEAGNLDMAIVKANLKKHDPEQLKLAFGQQGFENIQSIIQKFSKAKILNEEQIAMFKNAVAIRTGIAKSNVGKLEETFTTQQQQQASILGLQKENLITQKQILTDQLARIKEESALGVQGAQEQSAALLERIRTMRETAQEAKAAIAPAEKTVKETQAMLDEFNKPKGNILSKAGMDILRKAKWVGSYGTISFVGAAYGSSNITLAHAIEGVGLVITAEGLIHLMGSPAGRSALNALMSTALGTPQAMARATQVQAILQGLQQENKSP